MGLLVAHGDGEQFTLVSVAVAERRVLSAKRPSCQTLTQSGAWARVTWQVATSLSFGLRNRVLYKLNLY